jgi:hypothetical protein
MVWMRSYFNNETSLGVVECQWTSPAIGGSDGEHELLQ